MAPERTSRPGGANLPGMRNSAPASTALSSTALFAQTTDAISAAESDGPSRDEVRQRVDSLYNRAETDSGTFNATRAAGRAAAAGAGGAARTSGGAGFADVARQWFDVGRAKLGPTTAAALPADRAPARPAAAPPARPARRPESALALEGPKPADRPVAELTAGPAGSALPALPSPAQAPRMEATRALPAASADESGTTSLRARKKQNRQKLVQAGELLAAHGTRASTPLAADAWDTPAQPVGFAPGSPWQQAPPQLGLVQGASHGAGPDSAPVTVDGTAPVQDLPFTFDMSQTLANGLPVDIGQGFATAGSVDTSNHLPAIPSQPLATGSPVHPSLPYTTGDLTTPPSAAPAPAPVITGQSTDAGYDTKAAKVLEFARAQIGRPCVWGAAGPGSYDCAALVQAAWRAAGVTLPRTSQGQASVGTAVPLAEVRAGDLVFFHDDLSHVGLYAGNGLIVHAPGPGAHIREESVFHAGESAIRGAVRPV